MRTLIISVLTSLTLSFIGCSTNPSEVSINGFNAKEWQKDKFGCGSYRSRTADTLVAAQDKLTGLSEEGVISLLGKPDGQELYGRGQKFVIYITEASHRCQGNIADSVVYQKVPSLYIRLDALGRSNEVFKEQF